ncbi:hypothetical protein ACJRO7_021162 [Eucalyptus globulus]|uniref:TIR domain-containing protein n=1 Tax=Eucalyptus globulus TaxID=34317 RepID=A0ABD3KIW5_EUCGL
MDMGNGSEAGMSGGEPSVIDYDVFLSFRGPDTRQAFTDCLYHQMLEANIRVFLDEEELHVGEEIADELPAAIQKSKIYIPIFSKGYASSAWCLRELAHVVNCKKSKPSEKEIMPIFYDVMPHDVRLKSQRYISALEEHEEKFGRETRQKWEDALKSVAQIKGWELKKQGHWKFIQSVLQEIVMKLKTKDKYVTEHLVGMDDPMEAVLKLLDMDSGDLRFVLIHGMGGIGKTTLAKMVFNKLNSLFNQCCFLGNVQESSTSFGIINLQKQLLSDTLGLGFQDQINDVDDGIKVISQRLSNKKVLFVLDYVDDEEQLQKLAINHIMFGLGSRVIMTSRNKSIMKSNKTLEYEVKPLDNVQSLKLFSRHAFRRNPPPYDYVNLSRQIISTTGGLPLTLEVIGSLVYRQNKASWYDVLDNLREIPPEKVQDKLKISYNGLNHEQQQIFLDIACLFVDKDKTNALYMWKDCGFRLDYSIQVLVCLSLIKITDHNKFWMHDQLRDVGRKIVCGDTRLTDPRTQSRLWVREMANNIIGTKENQFSELRYMTCEGVSREFLAINFHPSNLVVLQLTWSLITEEWAGWSQFKVAKKLKVLDISYCSNMTKTPNFSNYLSLERLNLEGCEKLTKVDGSLKKLKCLIYFNAHGCKNLRELPKGIGGLQKLEYLDLSGCEKLRKLPKSFARVTSLVELDLSLLAITRLPDSIGNLNRLSILKLQFTKINELPNSIGNLRELKSLFLQYTKIRELPFSIGNLESLLELDLHANGCLDLEWKIPEDIWQLSLLRVLDLQFTLIKNVPQTIKLLPHLQKLSLGFCSKLKVLSELPTSLTSLSLGSRSLRQLPNLSNLTKLEDLSFAGYDENCSPFFFQDGQCQLSLGFLPLCVSTLSLQFHKSTTSLSFHCNLRKLTRLNIFGCSWNVVQLDGLEQLVEFDVSYSSLLEGFAGLSSLKRLKLLRLFSCQNLTAIQGLGSLDSLEQLDISFCPKIGSLDDLSDLKKLKSLEIGYCEELQAIKGLDELETLGTLTFSNCRSLKSFLHVFNLKVPDECVLYISGCSNLEADSFSGKVSTYKERKVRGKRRKRKRGV